MPMKFLKVLQREFPKQFPKEFTMEWLENYQKMPAFKVPNFLNIFSMVNFNLHANFSHRNFWRKKASNGMLNKFLNKLPKKLPQKQIF